MRRSRGRGPALLVAAALVVAANTVVASPVDAVIPDDFTVVTILPDVKRATSFAYAPDGAIFVAEKNGVVRVYEDGVPSIFLSFKDEVNDFGGRGLDSMVLDPDFATNRRVYLLYTEELRPDDPDRSYPANGKIIRISGSAADPHVADPATRVTLLTGYDHQSQAHGVAGLGFDAQGRLLASFGDGYNTTVDPRHLVAQNLDDLRGKLVRIDPDDGAGLPGNPYYNAAQPNSVRSKILARGFRNPWRFVADPVNQNVYVGDVGWGTWEELNTIRPSTTNPDKDLNGGWPCYEGENGVSAKQPGYATDPETASTCAALYEPSEGGTGIGALAPTYAYNHDEPGSENGSAIVAGPIYSGSTYPASFQGKMFFGDFARGSFRVRDPATGAVSDFGAAGDFGSPVDIHQAPSGNIAYLSIIEQQILEIVYTGANNPPVAVASANVSSGPPPLTVNFDGDDSSDPDPGDTLTYEWDFGDGSPVSTAPNPSHTYTAAGSYTAVLTVSDGRPGGTSSDSLIIDVGNTPPTVSFTSPGPMATYRIGDTIPVEIDADDVEDGALSGNDVAWDVIVHHLGHIHFEQSGTGTNGSYLVTDHDSDDTFLEFSATATDSFGRSTTTSRLVQPQKVGVTLLSDPPGVEVIVDGTPQTTPFTFDSIIGGGHQATAPNTATDQTGARAFDAWTSGQTFSDLSTFEFTTPNRALALNASYRPAIDGLSIGDASLAEGDDLERRLVFSIHLPAPAASDVSVGWIARAGSAAPPQDYDAAMGTATILAGTTSTTVFVPVNGDKRVEPGEYFFVELRDPVNASIADGRALGRIIDDDPILGPSLHVGDASVVEGDQDRRMLVFTVTLSEPPAGNVSVSFQTVSGTASTGSDFTARSGIVTFTPSQRSKSVTVTVRGDVGVEPSEQFTLHLSNPVGATIMRADGIGWITGDD